MELISIIVPVYKVESYLKICIDSILNQTYRNFEVILVDDGSPDNCGAICDEYAQKDNRVKVIHQINQGLSKARNVGLDIAQGQYIMFVDSDDWIEINTLEYSLDLSKQYDADIVHCACKFVDIKGKEQVKKSKKINQSEVEVWDRMTLLNKYLYGKINTTAWGKLYKRKIFDETRFPVGMKAEDTYIMIDIILSTNCYVCSAVRKYNYLIAREGGLMQTASKSYLLDHIKAVQRNRMQIEKKFPELTEEAEHRYLRSLIGATITMINSNNIQEDIYLQIDNEINRMLKTVMKNKTIGITTKVLTIIYLTNKKLYEMAIRTLNKWKIV